MEKGARLHVPRSSTPALFVGSDKLMSSYRMSRLTSIGWRMLDANNVVVKDAGPRLRVTSSDALRPRSATSGAGMDRRDRPAASVSSVNGVGAKNPCPADNRLVHPPPRIKADSRGLRNVPYCL